MALDKKKLKAVGELIRSWKRVMIVTHEKPDGDALGSLVALKRMLESLGHEVKAVCFDSVPPRYASCCASAELLSWSDGGEQLLEAIDGIVIADTCSYSQLGPIAGYLAKRKLPVLAIDHHITRDELADEYCIDETASSTCLILAELAQVMNWPVDQDTANAFFMGMATDTGWFRFSNIDARAFTVAASLLENGAQANGLYESLYMSHSLPRLRLIGRVLTEMEIVAEGKIAIMKITPAILNECGALQSDTEEIVNQPLSIGTVDASILLVGASEELTKVSLRSKHLINVATVAQSLGGGGHERAAGVRIHHDIDQAQKVVLDTMVQHMQERKS